MQFADAKGRQRRRRRRRGGLRRRQRRSGCGSLWLTDQLWMALAGRCDRTRSRVRAEQSRAETANYESEAAKGEGPFLQSIWQDAEQSQRQPGPGPKPTLRPTPTNRPCHHPVRRDATQSHRREKTLQLRMRKMKMAKRKTQRSANCEANCDVGSEKPKRLRKSRKFTEKLQNVTFHPLRTKTDCGGEVGQDYQARPGQDRAGQAGSQPENALFQCRLPPDAITANEETSCRPPFLFSFFLSHTHRHGRMHRHIYYSEFCVCVWHAYSDISCGFRQFTTKCQEWWKASAGTKSFSSRRRLCVCIGNGICCPALWGLPCSAALLLSHTHSLSLSLLCLSKYLCRCSSGQMPRCLAGFFLFSFFFFGSSCACRLSDY